MSFDSRQQQLNARLFNAVGAGDAPAVNRALDDGADVNAPRPGDIDSKPLHAAAISGRADVVRALIEGGAKLEPLGDYHLTPLHYAAAHGHIAVTKALLEAGILPDLQSKEGDTALHLAAHNRTDNQMRVATLLLAAGADLTLKNILGNTPQDVARIKQYSDIAACLQEVADDPAKRPLANEAGLDLPKRVAALHARGKPVGRYTEAVREAQRQEALRGGGI